MSKVFRKSGSVQTELSRKYMGMLAKHFARKVEVELNEKSAHVKFPMGLCDMKVDGHDLSFDCCAESEQALEAVAGIIDGHLHLLKKLPDKVIEWRYSDFEQAPDR